jgi:hypothetical protein
MDKSEFSPDVRGIVKFIRQMSYLLLVFILAGNSSLSAQGKFSLTAGWGYYELANAGGQWNMTDVSSLSLYAGTNFGLGNSTAWSAGLAFDQTFRKPIVWKLKPGYSVGLLYWENDDDLYHFRNMSLPVMAVLAYPASKKITLRAEGGFLFNMILESDRKQNVEAGYPERFNGNVKLSVIYKLGVK